MNLKELIVKNKETVQIAYGVFLIILIPLLIAYNTIFIINIYNQSLDAALQRQALTVGRSIYALMKNDLSAPAGLQAEIEKLSTGNSDIQDLSVLIPNGENFKTVAASRKEDVGKTTNSPYYMFAWKQPDNDGIVTDSLKLSAAMEGEDLAKSFATGERFWLVAMPMSDAAGKKQAILTIKISSKIIDDLTAENRNASIFLLFITILIVILFLAATVRLWDYAVLYRKIKEVDQMKDEFISIASHELRTPLTITKGYISMILEGIYGKIENPEVEKAIRTVANSNHRLEALVEDLLNVSRIEQGRLQVAIKDIEIEPIIEGVMTDLKVKADEKNLALEYLKSANPLPKISADPERLKQVLINLIGNSVKYTLEGSVKITSEAKSNMMEIKIVDTGVGMSAEDQKNLFEKFYRVQNERTEKIVGTGLGLWITKQMIELMKGKITIESMEGVGTQVAVRLPLAKK